MMPANGGLQGGLAAADLESGAANNSQLLHGANRMEKQESRLFSLKLMFSIMKLYKYQFQ